MGRPNTILLLLFGSYKSRAIIHYYYWPLCFRQALFIFLGYCYFFIDRFSLLLIIKIYLWHHRQHSTRKSWARKMSFDAIYREVPFIFHESFRFLIGKWMMPPNKNRIRKVDPYQRYLTPLENLKKKNSKRETRRWEWEREKSLQSETWCEYENTKIIRANGWLRLNFHEAWMSNVCTLNLLCTSHRFGSNISCIVFGISAFGYRYYPREHSAYSIWINNVNYLIKSRGPNERDSLIWNFKFQNLHFRLSLRRELFYYYYESLFRILHLPLPKCDKRHKCDLCEHETNIKMCG